MLHSAIEKGKSSINGVGLFATERIYKGEVVWKRDPEEEMLTESELERLTAEEQAHAYQYNDLYIIASDDGQYMNHSCDPNTWWLDDDTLIASRDIFAGEEVTYDYATTDVGDDTHKTWTCSCGARNCRKIITLQDCLDERFQKRFHGYLPSWTQSFINKHRKSS